MEKNNNMIITQECNDLIEQLKNKAGDIRTIGVNFYKNINGSFDEILNLWKKANYTPQQVEWINYYPEKDFDEKFINTFFKDTNLKLARAWVSKIKPGKSAPWHKDVDDNLEQYESKGKLTRYTCYLNAPAYGQVLSIDNKTYYMVPQGTMIKWGNYMDWHGASNCGFEDQYLFHFLGYEQDS